MDAFFKLYLLDWEQKREEVRREEVGEGDVKWSYWHETWLEDFEPVYGVTGPGRSTAVAKGYISLSC